MWSKEAFLAANITFCVRAAWRDPWCFLEGICLQLSAWWKSWQSDWQNATKWWNPSLRWNCEFQRSKGESSRDRRRKILCLWLLFLSYFFFLNPQGGMEETGCAADICWIPHRANDIMQRFLNKLYPAWGESGRKDLPHVDYNTGGRRSERRWGTHQGMFDPSIKQRWLIDEFLLLRNRSFAIGK